MNRLIVSVILLILSAVAATACADVTQPALEVNGETVGRGEMAELIVDLRPPATGDDPARVGGQGNSDGCFTRDLAVSQSIIDMLVRDEIGRLGGSITEADLETARGIAELEIVERQRFTEDARGFIEDVIGAQTALGRLVETEDVGVTIQRLIEDADVAIDSRFGDWVDGVGFVGVESSCTAF